MAAADAAEERESHRLGRHTVRTFVIAVLCSLTVPAAAQEKFEVKVAEFVGPQHFMTQW